MSIQSQLNYAAYEQLPKTLNAIKSALISVGSIESIAQRMIMSCTPCLDSMNSHQKDKLDDEIMNVLKEKNYV